MAFTASDYVVLLLGAGSSAAYKPPLMRDFMDVARRRYVQIKSGLIQSFAPWLVACYDAIFEFHGVCQASAWALKRDWDNIEELYTQADFQRLSASSQLTEPDSLCKQISWVIWDVCRECDTGIGLEDIARNVFESGLQPAIITTNYDLVCESGLGFRSRSAFPFCYLGLDIPENAPGLGILRDPSTRRGSERKAGQRDAPCSNPEVAWLSQLVRGGQVWEGLHCPSRDD